jgi:hypothetical protein
LGAFCGYDGGGNNHTDEGKSNDDVMHRGFPWGGIQKPYP